MRDTVLHIVVPTQHGVVLAQRVAETFGQAVQIFARTTDDMPAASVNGTVERYDTPLWQQIGVLLRDGIPLIIIAPIPEVVTLLARHLQAESSHPPVVALDTEGQFVVPLIRDAMGQSDMLAERIAAQIGATPVISRSLVLGIGAEKSVPAEDFEAAVSNVLQRFGLTPAAVKVVATLDRRAVEDGFRDWVTQHGWSVLAYTAEQLAAIQEMPNPSTIVA